MKKLSTQRGLTLIELIVVIVIVGVLAGVLLAIINPGSKVKQARDADVKNDVAQVASALEAYYASKLYYPDSLDVLVTTTEIKTVPQQPSGSAYSYEKSPAGCTETGATKCTAASVYGTLNEDPTKVWCWRSATGNAEAVVGATCSPDVTAVPTPTPTPTL